MPLLPVYNERTDFDLEVSHLDADGNALVPTTSFYSIYDVASETDIRAWTAYAVDGTGDATISVTADDTAIKANANAYEERVLTIQGTYGVDKEFAEEYRFRVKNLTKIPKV
jgi:hypothetical protein